ncbi:MAG: DDE-type integrase/transposase/recombinase [Planctomycetes bacterium]|nr:DDE-type integrase/transposase/recombinase [Planctomycetota bacterium]
MTKHGNPPGIPLPAGWSQHARSATLHVISLAQFALAYTRGWAVNSRVARVRLKAENDRLRQQVAWLTEEIRIKDARMKRTAPQRRPHYVPAERMSILELRAARAWSLQQTADAFLVTPATIAYWMKRLDDEGPDVLVQIREPVNKFPHFVRYTVQRLKALCPGLGKVKIAQILCRAGLHLGATTVGRILKEAPPPKPREASRKAGRVVTAKDPNHVWHIDLTAVPIRGGFWTPRLPFALPQCWPFCWWLAIVVDHFSRRAIGFAVFPKRPSSLAVRTFVGKTAARIHATPKYLICDKDSIFWCMAFKGWCKRKAIRPRYGAIGKHGSIAVVERLIRTIKDEATRRIVVPQRQAAFRRELTSYLAWYNEHRPHATLHGKTPNEVYFRLRPANQRPRIEPRERWPRPSPCARPGTLIAGQPGDRFEIEVGFHDGRRHLPIVSVRRAA